jgi:hypothetical protein
MPTRTTASRCTTIFHTRQRALMCVPAPSKLFSELAKCAHCTICAPAAIHHSHMLQQPPSASPASPVSPSARTSWPEPGLPPPPQPSSGPRCRQAARLSACPAQTAAAAACLQLCCRTRREPTCGRGRQLLLTPSCHALPAELPKGGPRVITLRHCCTMGTAGCACAT